MNPLNQLTSSSMTLEALQTLLDPIYALASHNHAGIYSPVGHSHTISDTTGLQTALDAKLSLVGGTLTGNVTAKNVTFKHTSSVNPGGFAVRDHSANLGGDQSLEIADPRMTVGKGIRFSMFGGDQVNCGSSLVCESSLATPEFVVVPPGGFGAGNSVNNIRLSADAIDDTYIISGKYGVNVGPNLTIITKDFVVRTGSATTWIPLYGNDVERFRITSAGDAAFSGSVKVGPITFATLPSASANTGAVYRVTDRTQKHCYSDGTNWLWVHDNSTVS